ncbi:unnamed protein product [Kluyveromyces dobzhanskii CBS 2104]|uniref:WGS project CCBQ000000000 data, contig 00011 n=1 Tax=Kluyveromyces dobzhanskii CBS 2104 TaxID=1427455 RepID=A0A0A8LA66_9SACH|nr:unnamed protein product [Kluyveromyces dobzhanskii CBS 2104]
MKWLTAGVRRASTKASTHGISTNKTPLIRNILLASGSAAIATLSWKYYQINDSQTELSREYFTKYHISKKYAIDQNHFLVQLTPLKPQRVNLWKEMNSSKLWSVEVMQPQIMVVRNYTPLPLKIDDNNSVEVLRDGENADGTLTFYIKQYTQGEVARWINRLPLGHVVELRGPFVEYEFPENVDEVKRDRSFLWGNQDNANSNFKYQPFDILFFTGGTGIVTLLQMTLTESPFRGKIGVYHSCRSLSELGPLHALLTKLEDNKRIELRINESKEKYTSFRSNATALLKSIPPPYPYNGTEPFKTVNSKLEPVQALVCGPDGFISTVSGPIYDTTQGPIKGILGSLGWNNANVYKLS